MIRNRKLTISFYVLIVALWVGGFLGAHVAAPKPAPKLAYHPDRAITQMPCKAIGPALYGPSDDGKQMAETIVAEFTDAGLSQSFVPISQMQLLNYCSIHQDTNLHDAVIAVQHVLMPPPDLILSGSEARQ